MFSRISLTILVFGWSAAANLFAQTPAKSVPASATPAAQSTPPSSASPATKSVVDSTDPNDLKEAIKLLKDNYLKPEALDEKELSRATFEGVLSRLGHGVVLLNPATEPTPSMVSSFGEILEGHVGYVRPGDLSRPNLESFDASLKEFNEKKVDAVVIDLRASAIANDFEIAAEFTKRFCPKGQPLFSLRKTATKQERTFTSDRDPAFQGLIVILVDGDTTGAAEAMAGAIRLHDKALLVGQPTAGRAVEYSDLKLPSGKILRVAVAEALLPEAKPLFPEGLKPDVPVDMPAADKRIVFQQSRDKGMTQFVVENERPHLNEAALLSGTNPELEAMEAAQRNGHAPEKAKMSDPVVQRSLDLVTSIGVFQRH
jgi:hypothetical protein